MNILFFSNTGPPFIGGVERSIMLFSEELRNRGHRVVIVLPEFENTRNETDIIRVPALQKFNGSDFSVPLPIPVGLRKTLGDFLPDIIHSHHPYLLGDTALRLAAAFKVPIVFTFHTFYEQYTHYVPGDSPALKRFVIALSSGYANLCDCVIAPSRGVREELIRRGVTVPIEIIPTGIDIEAFRDGDGNRFRREAGAADDEFIIGHVGRLAPEKNMLFLASAVASFMQNRQQSRFFLVGLGLMLDHIRAVFTRDGVVSRFHHFGAIRMPRLTHAYHSFDVFAFASQTETQGLVLSEAMAAGVPVVVLDGPGITDVVRDGWNGTIVPATDYRAFSAALSAMAAASPEERRRLRNNARATAVFFSKQQCARRLLDVYERLYAQKIKRVKRDHSHWKETRRLIAEEIKIISNMAKATGAAFDEKRLSGPFSYK